MGAVKPGSRPVREAALGLWTMVAIAVGVILVIIIVIDVSCYFLSGCGITMCICVKLCDRQPTDADDTAELKETNNRNNDVEAPPTQQQQQQQPASHPPATQQDDRYNANNNNSYYYNYNNKSTTRAQTLPGKNLIGNPDSSPDFRINSDPDTDPDVYCSRIAPIMWIHSLAGMSHFAKYCNKKLSCRRETARSFIEYFAKSLKVTQGYSK